MRKTTLKLYPVRAKGKRYWQVRVPKLGGGRDRKTFESHEQAKAYYDLAKAQIQDFGTAAMSISDALRAEAVKCSQMLQSFGKTITDAAEFYVDHLREITHSQTVSHAVSELQSACKADGKSVRYLRDLKYRLGRFAEDFGSRHIAEISTADIDGWLRQLNLGPVSRNTFRRRLVTLFKFAKTRGWCRTIPPAESTRVREIADEVGILTPKELKGLLDVASEDTIPYWTIAAFAGLRASEIERLDWADVNARHIRVRAKHAKTASRRLVDIQPNLRKWLLPYRGKAGKVTPENLRVKLLADRKRAADAGSLTRKWPSNALRHSFASYYLARFDNAAKLALQLGHVGQDIIFRHYREVVTRADAKRYWSIFPESKSTKVVPFKAAA
ncbi:MAG TPA: tyrosine-type recombinase/integrase [Candidatus Udaeobacter sp.]|nr:tyrosine-type recombinase/integrase [Candidatus Udaeobacter sp.]